MSSKDSDSSSSLQTTDSMSSKDSDSSSSLQTTDFTSNKDSDSGNVVGNIEIDKSRDEDIGSEIFDISTSTNDITYVEDTNSNPTIISYVNNIFDFFRRMFSDFSTVMEGKSR